MPYVPVGFLESDLGHHAICLQSFKVSYHITSHHITSHHRNAFSLSPGLPPSSHFKQQSKNFIVQRHYALASRLLYNRLPPSSLGGSTMLKPSRSLHLSSATFSAPHCTRSISPYMHPSLVNQSHREEEERRRNCRPTERLPSPN